MTSHTWVATTEGKQRYTASPSRVEDRGEPDPDSEADMAGAEDDTGEAKDDRKGVTGDDVRREIEMQLGRPKRLWSDNRTSVRLYEGR